MPTAGAVAVGTVGPGEFCPCEDPPALGAWFFEGATGFENEEDEVAP